MELKRIIARDSRAANDKAIQLYGPDVLVISSQRLDNQTELIVAIDTQQAEPLADPTALQTQAVASSAAQPASKEEARCQAFSEVFKVSIENPQTEADEPDSDWEPAALRLAGTAPAAGGEASVVGQGGAVSGLNGLIPGTQGAEGRASLVGVDGSGETAWDASDVDGLPD